MRTRIIKAAALVACCGAVASCAGPAQARSGQDSHAASTAAPATAAPVRHPTVKATPSGPPSGAARPTPTPSASGTATPAGPGPVKTAPNAVSLRPGSILGVYNGTVPRSYSLVNSFARKVRLRPNVVMYFSAWGDRFRTGFASVARRHGAVPFVELEPYTVSLQSIAAGQQDAYLRSYANAVRSFGDPVLISFGHEMNGFWYRWGYTHTSPSVFRSAWRHIVTVFRRAGASNVRWLWVVNGLAPGESPIREWWPGADYVGKASKVPGLFAGVRAAHLLGFVYYDKAQHGDAYHQNWQIDYDWSAIAAFRRSIKRYFG